MHVIGYMISRSTCNEMPGKKKGASRGPPENLLGSSWDLMGGLGGKKRLMERLGVALWSPSARPGAVLGSVWTSDPPS